MSYQMRTNMHTISQKFHYVKVFIPRGKRKNFTKPLANGSGLVLYTVYMEGTKAR